MSQNLKRIRPRVVQLLIKCKEKKKKRFVNKTTTTTEKRKVFSFMGGTWRVRCPSVLTTTRNIFHWGGWHTLRLYSPPPRRPFLFFFFIVMGTKKKRGRTRRSSSRVAYFVNCVFPDFRRHILEYLFLRHLTLFFFFLDFLSSILKKKNRLKCISIDYLVC